MRVCIYGAGAIGGMIGYLLKKQGIDITLIARRDHYNVIKKNGLTFISNEFNIEETQKFKIFDNLDNLGKFDLVINSLKAHAAIRKRVGSGWEPGVRLRLGEKGEAGEFESNGWV